MSVIKKIKVGETTYDIAMDLVSNIQTPSTTEAPSTEGVTTYVTAEIAKIPSPMVFKGTLGTGGTITSLPTAAKNLTGHTYKVITAGTYASQTAKVGDLFICDSTPAWVWVPSGDEPDGTVTNIATGTGLTGGPITTSGTISVDLNGGDVGAAADIHQFVQSVSLDSSGNLTGIVTPFVTTITNSVTAPTAGAVKAYVDANGVEFITDNRSASGAALTGVTTRTSLYDGMQICYALDYAAGTNATLNLTLPNGNTTGAVPIYIRGTTRLGTHYPAGSNLQMVYMTHYKVAGVDQGAAWLCVGYYDTNYYAACWCGTAASTRAKVGTCYTFALKANSYLFVNMRYANSYKSGSFTFNVNSTGAKTVYINGTVSSSSNYTLPAGGYIAYYDGSYWHFRTDGKLPGPGAVHTYDTTISSSSANTNAPGTLAVYEYVQDNKLTKENSITSSATHNTVPSSLAVKNYVDANAGGTSIDVEIGTDQGGMLNLDSYTPTSGKISYLCMIPSSDYIISGATTGYGFWICYGDSWTECSSVKWCKNGTWITCYNSDYYSGGENPVGIYRAGNAIWVKVDYTNTSNRPVAYLLTLPEPYGGSTAY